MFLVRVEAEELMNLTWFGKMGMVFMIASCMLGVVSMATRSVTMLWCSAAFSVIAGVLMTFEATKHKR